MKHIFCLIFLMLFFLQSQNVLGDSCVDLVESKVPESVWGANFLNRYNSFDFSENPMSIGVEIEAVVPKTIGRSGLANIVEKVIKSLYPTLEVKREYNVITYEKKGFLYRYDVYTDVSIFPGPKEQGVELRSPILRDQEDVDVFHEVVERLKTEGKMTPKPTTAGVHVHIGFPDGRAQELALLANLFGAIEKKVAKTFSVVSSRRRSWADWTTNEIKELLDANETDDLTLKDIFSRAGSTKRGLNLEAILNHGTVEFKIFNSSVSPEEIQLMMNFASTLVRAVREKDPRLIQFLSDHQGEKELPFEGLVGALDLELGTSEHIVELLHKKTLRQVRKEKLTGMPAFITATAVASYIALVSWGIFF